MEVRSNKISMVVLARKNMTCQLLVRKPFSKTSQTLEDVENSSKTFVLTTFVLTTFVLTTFVLTTFVLTTFILTTFVLTTFVLTTLF